MLVRELYEKLPEPLKTEHTWRYSEYSFFVKDKEPKTIVQINQNTKFESDKIEITKGDLFEPLTLKYPEKITLHNLIHHKEKFSLDISKSGFYSFEQKLLGEYNILRTQIRIANNIETDLIISLSDELKNSTNNNVIEIEAQENSKVRIFFDNHFLNSYIHNFIYLDMKDNTDVRLLFSTFNPKYEKTHVKALINGVSSNFIVFILAKLSNNDHVDYRTENVHLKSNSKSLSVYRSIVNDQARSIYTGMLRIEKEAKYCNAYQNSRNILLSEKARVETIPELEILNQEVACTHGAVVSSLDEESIYYFMSRGVSREEAIKLLTDGFLLDKLEDNFGEKLYSIIYRKVTGEEHI
ncbi:MAG: SufD family Fe-S cluster assembly protein [Candidatus Calescibacterium sp.]|nr:SufD family Fe-S cluster assembly protein [Candidatus Calescibacterium sp.]MDW8132332.1 SufD family Fe-S cluster assembly protein [Candidatus Calescibacterium sp.]